MKKIVSINYTEHFCDLCGRKIAKVDVNDSDFVDKTIDCKKRSEYRLPFNIIDSHNVKNTPSKEMMLCEDCANVLRGVCFSLYNTHKENR